MPNQLLAESDIYDLTKPLQQDGFSYQRGAELIAAVSLSHVSEPGDRMAGALARILGPVKVVELLIDGFDPLRVRHQIQLVGATDQLSEMFGDLPATISDSRQRWLPRFSKQEISKLLVRTKDLGLHLLLPGDKSWPQGLEDLGDGGPSVVFVQGRQAVLASLGAALSIVGSRACSDYGVKVTKKLVSELAFQKRATVSGGAIGIDSQVHLSSLQHQLPTVAVMAGGLDRKYPSSNSKLFQAIQISGALISELPPGAAPTRWRFLQRNRLIAALTPTTVVIEAGTRSGSIRTANNALDIGRELFAVPGEIFSASSSGTNGLISEGKARPLIDTKIITSVASEPSRVQNSSALSIRAQDALRELRRGTSKQIATSAGLTQLELGLAIQELKDANQLSCHQDSQGVLHYALKYAHGT